MMAMKGKISEGNKDEKHTREESEGSSKEKTQTYKMNRNAMEAGNYSAILIQTKCLNGDDIENKELQDEFEKQLTVLASGQLHDKLVASDLCQCNEQIICIFYQQFCKQLQCCLEVTSANKRKGYCQGSCTKDMKKNVLYTPQYNSIRASVGFVLLKQTEMVIRCSWLLMVISEWLMNILNNRHLSLELIL